MMSQPYKIRRSQLKHLDLLPPERLYEPALITVSTIKLSGGPPIDMQSCSIATLTLLPSCAGVDDAIFFRKPKILK